MRAVDRLAEDVQPQTRLERGEAGSVRYGCVDVGPEGVAEVDARGRIVFVPREKIRRIVFRKGMATERPLLHAFFAVVCFGIGWGTFAVYRGWQAQGGILPAEVMGGFTLVPLGIGMLWALFRRRFFLRVETADDARHLIFRGKLESTELKRFLDDMESDGYVVEREAVGFERRNSPYRDP
jgi:hypothetical protein